VNVRTRLRGLTSIPRAGAGLASRLEVTVSVEAAFPLPALNGDAAGIVSRLRELRRHHPHLRSASSAPEAMGQAVRGGVPGCLAGKAFFNVDHRGRASKCLEFRGVPDRVGTLPEDTAGRVRTRLRAAHASNDCRACWYASRAEIELLHLRGFLGVRTLVARGSRLQCAAFLSAAASHQTPEMRRTGLRSRPRQRASGRLLGAWT
jgi:hypothetical protein